MFKFHEQCIASKADIGHHITYLVYMGQRLTRYRKMVLTVHWNTTYSLIHMLLVPDEGRKYKANTECNATIACMNVIQHDVVHDLRSLTITQAIMHNIYIVRTS